MTECQHYLVSEQEPRVVDIGPVEFTAGAAEFRVTGIEVIPADKIRTEDSDTPKYLGTASGHYFKIYSRVLLSVYGEWHEITRDSLPENYMKQDEE